MLIMLPALIKKFLTQEFLFLEFVMGFNLWHKVWVAVLVKLGKANMDQPLLMLKLNLKFLMV